MPEESTTSDLVELVRRFNEAGNSGDFDLMLRFLAPDAVWEGALGGTYEGPAAIRGLLEEWMGSYEELVVELEEVLDLGNGVTFSVLIQNGRPVGISGEVRFRHASISIWVEGLVVRTVIYLDIHEARAAAERLAEERG